MQRFVSFAAILAAAALFGLGTVTPQPVYAQVGLFASADVSYEVQTQDPDFVIQANVRVNGTKRNLMGGNSHSGGKKIVADLGRLELVPRCKGTIPMQILDGAWSLRNDGDPMKDWEHFKHVDDGLGAVIDLENSGNGDRGASMWIRVKNGNRKELRWLFIRRVRKSPLNAPDLFPFHILSIRDGEGNILPQFLRPNGQIDFDSIVRILIDYGTGMTPGYVLGGGGGRPSNGGGGGETPVSDHPIMIFTSPIRRYVRVQWYKDAEGEGEGPTDDFLLEPDKEYTLDVRTEFPFYQVYDRVDQKGDWNAVTSGGKQQVFRTFVRGIRKMPFTR